MLNLGYRRQLTEKLAFQHTVRDLLDNFGDTLVTDTSSFIDRTDREFGGLTWSFGATPKRERDPQFDFSAPTTGGRRGHIKVVARACIWTGAVRRNPASRARPLRGRTIRSPQSRPRGGGLRCAPG